jgi:hypothetical protein
MISYDDIEAFTLRKKKKVDSEIRMLYYYLLNRPRDKWRLCDIEAEIDEKMIQFDLFGNVYYSIDRKPKIICAMLKKITKEKQPRTMSQEFWKLIK